MPTRAKDNEPAAPPAQRTDVCAPADAPLEPSRAAAREPLRGAALEPLRSVEAQYRAIFENAIHGIYQSLPEGRFLNVNPALARMLGYDSPADMIACCNDIAHAYYADPADRDVFRRLIAQRGILRGYEVLVRRKDGTPVWTRENVYEVRDDEGRLLYYEGSVEDVTAQKQTEAALRESEERYRNLFEYANDVIYTTDLAGYYTSVNQVGERVTGYSRAELCRMNFAQLVAPEHLALTQEMMARKLAGQEETTFYEIEIIHKAGARVLLEVSTQLIRERGRPVGVQGIARDITERKRAEAALRESEERYRELFENANDIVYTHDLQGNFTSLNKTGERVTGYTRAEALGLNMGQVIAPEHVGLARAMIGRKQAAPDATVYELEIIAKDGRRVPLEISTRLVYEAGRAVCVQGIARDITERKQAEERLRQHALSDALTGLPNRLLFTDHLHLAVEQHKRQPAHHFAVLFLDLDRFKMINDSLGHGVGDQLLVAIARQLERCLRAGDTVARLGGDEFAILLNDLAHFDDAIRVAERVLRGLMLPFNLDGHEVYTTASIGIALSNNHYETAEAVLRDADTAMYRAKADGKARYKVFDMLMHARVVALLQLETDLRRAIERGEFCLHFQPIVALADGRINGFEALVRWQHPERGLIAPGEFVPVAEETGLIVPLDRWVLRAACAQMKRWQALAPAYQDLKLSVNLSGKHFAQVDLCEQIEQVLAATGFEPRRLQLEITESVLMESAKAIVPMLARLRALGVELAIDDFGTGYSSLSYLRRFPIHTLKIDRSFIGGTGEDDAEIVRTIVLLARNMRKDVVAEGVETAAQHAALRALDCTYGQGYYFSPPLDAAAAEHLLRRALAADRAIIPAPDERVA
ncbi:MAG TPA: PAS domain S-box protein [Pyrinomonadaceae bacterium]|jgi:diguanylate cyclase (GGDEF)-like protein/PAS domain S-box-containing protein